MLKKSTCIRFGARYYAECACLSLAQGKPIQWSSHCRYLGVYFATGRAFKCSFDRSKYQFFKSLNAIFNEVGRFASEQMVLSLLRAKCLLVLLYGVESYLLLVRDKRSLEFAVIGSFMKLFRTGSAAVFDGCQKFFPFLPVTYQTDIRTAKFLQKFMTNDYRLQLIRQAGRNKFKEKIFKLLWQC